MKKSGFTITELLIVVAIMAVMLGGLYMLLATGQAGWFTTDANIQLLEGLRQTLERVTMELRQSQVGQGAILDGAGPGTTDLIRFAIPILCQTDVGLLDGNGDVANWGAPLTWGCTDPSCMDADNDCSTRDYNQIEYGLNAANELVRRVLDTGGTAVREDTFAQNINDFQVVLNGSIVTVTVTAERQAENKRDIAVTTSADVFLRN